MTRTFPFREISARPRWAASTVRYFTSLTRMPVEQMASISRASRSCPPALAVSTSCLYSPRSSSWDASRNTRRWIFRNFTFQLCPQ